MKQIFCKFFFPHPLEHTCEAGNFYLVLSNFSSPELPPDEGAKLGGERVGVEAIVSL